MLVSFTPKDSTLDSYLALLSVPVPTSCTYSPRSTAHTPGGPAFSESLLQTSRAITTDLLLSRSLEDRTGDVSGLMIRSVMGNVLVPTGIINSIPSDVTVSLMHTVVKAHSVITLLKVQIVFRN